MEVFIRNNKIYEIKKTEDESREIYLERIKYIFDKIENTKYDFKDIILQSYIWRNMKYYKMKYPSSITKKI